MRTNSVTRLLILCIANVLACAWSAGQSPKTPNQPQRNKALSQRDFEEQQNALQTLLYLRNNAFEVDSAPDRVRVLLEIADALWLIDKEEAREVFRQSFARAAEFDNSTTGTRPPLSPKELQQLVITRVAKRDPALAKSLLLSAPQPDAPQSDVEAFAELYGANDKRTEMLVKAAAETLATDTNQALQMAKLAMAGGYTQYMRHFLLSLRARDRVASDALFELALQYASNRHPKKLSEALFLWDYAFQRPTAYLGSVSWFREAPVEYPVALDVRKRALGFAVDAVIENAAQFYVASASEVEKPLVLERYTLLHSVATQILPDVQRFMPAATETLLAQLSRLNQELRAQGRELPGPPEPIPSSSDVQVSVDKLLERAAKAANVAARDGLYAKAALRLYLNGDYERAIDIARNVDDATLRLKLTEPIRFDWAGNLISRKQLDAALSIAQAVETLELRVAILARLAAACFENKTTHGIAVLNEAESTANKAKSSSYLASAVLGIGQVYLQIKDRNQAKASISTAIRLINATEEAAGWDFLSSTSEKSGRLAVQDTRWESRRDGGISSLYAVYPRITGLLEVLSEISESDLDEGLMLARQIKRKELNYATQAALCGRTIERIQRNNKSAKTVSARRF